MACDATKGTGVNCWMILLLRLQRRPMPQLVLLICPWSQAWVWFPSGCDCAGIACLQAGRVFPLELAQKQSLWHQDHPACSGSLNLAELWQHKTKSVSDMLSTHGCPQITDSFWWWKSAHSAVHRSYTFKVASSKLPAVTT